MLKVAPSILISDFANLQSEIKSIEKSNADWLHLDVMDGMFVPNLSFGPPVITSLRGITDLVFDTHLMVQKPHLLLDLFLHSGSDNITFHIESESPVLETIKRIKAHGKKAGLTLKPATPISALFPYINDVDMVLVMSVEPGFGGQKFMPETLERIRALKKFAQANGSEILIEVDGGINAENAVEIATAGADVAVVGTAFFRAPNKADFVSKMHML